MNKLISAKELRASLPKVVAQVQRGARYTVLYRSRPAFQVVPVNASPDEVGDLRNDPLYQAPAVGASKDGLSAADHDALLYKK